MLHDEDKLACITQCVCGLEMRYGWNFMYVYVACVCRRVCIMCMRICWRTWVYDSVDVAMVLIAYYPQECGVYNMICTEHTH